jgi:hypothetical protein
MGFVGVGRRYSMKRLIHRKQLNKITSVEFSYNDVTITQDGALVVLDKDEILEIANLIVNERHDLEVMAKWRKDYAN